MENIKNKVCKYCGKPYKVNGNIPDFLPDFIKEKIKFIPDCDCLEKISQEEMEEREEKRQRECINNKIKKYKDLSVMDNKFLESTFDTANFDKNLKLSKVYAEKFIKKIPNVGILFFGNAGTGKTFASSCIANYLMKNGKTVLVINIGLYLNKLKENFFKKEKDFSENKFLQEVGEVDLLILDDFGTETPSDFTIEKIFNLVDNRYRSKKPLIITTNLNSIKGIEDYYLNTDIYHRISDRLNSMVYPVQMVGESKRENTRNSFFEFIAG